MLSLGLRFVFAARRTRTYRWSQPCVDTEELLDLEQIDGRTALITTARHQRFSKAPFYGGVNFASDGSRPVMVVWACCSSEAGRDQIPPQFSTVSTPD